MPFSGISEIDLLVFVFGCLIGSFLNVVGLRFLSDESIVFPPSHCDSCDRRILPHENIPIVSWLFLRGKCSGCKAAIHWQYPLVEASTGVLFATIVHQHGVSLQSVLLMVLIANFMVILITDFREQYIFDINSLGLIPVGLVYSYLNLSHIPGDPVVVFGLPWLSLAPSFVSALWAIGGSFALFFGLNLYSKFIAGSDGFGEGDNRLLMGIGAFFGLPWIIMTFVLGFLLQAALGIPMTLIQWARHKAYTPIGLTCLGFVAALTPYAVEKFFPHGSMLLVVAVICGAVALWSSIRAIRVAKALEIPLTYCPFGPALILGCLGLLFFGANIRPLFQGLFPH